MFNTEHMLFPLQKSFPAVDSMSFLYCDSGPLLSKAIPDLLSKDIPLGHSPVGSFHLAEFLNP